jgi:hypothetical protein
MDYSPYAEQRDNMIKEWCEKNYIYLLSKIIYYMIY